jgi:hypothetical protein
MATANIEEFEIVNFDSNEDGTNIEMVAAHPVDSSSGTDENKSAGFALPLVVFFFLTAVGLILITSPDVTIKKGNESTSRFFVADLAFTVFMIGGLVVMVLFLLLDPTTPIDDRHGTSTNAHQHWQGSVRHHLVLFGIIPFFFIGSTLIIAQMAAECRCLDVWSQCHGNRIFRLHLTALSYTIARAVFTGFEMILCCLFHRRHFRKTTPVMLGLAVLQSANAILWVDSLITESYTEAKTNGTKKIIECYGEEGLYRNHTSHVIACVTMTKIAFSFIHTYSAYLYPFEIEFLFLVVECVAHWFIDCAADGPHDVGSSSQSPTSVRDRPEVQSCLYNFASRLLWSVRYRYYEWKHLRRTGEPNEANEETSLTAELNRKDQGQNARRSMLGRLMNSCGSQCSSIVCRCLCRFPWNLLWQMFTCVFHVVFVLIAIVDFNYNGQDFEQIFYSYRIVFWSMLVLCDCVGQFTVGCRQPSRPRDGVEWLFIVTSFATFCRLMLSVLANVFSTHDRNRVDRFLDELLDVGQVLMQTVFYFYAKDVRVNPGGAKTVFKAVVFYMAVGNGFRWFEHSLIESHHPLKSFESNYYANWSFIKSVMEPAELIYRFNSFILFMNVYLDFIQQQKSAVD